MEMHINGDIVKVKRLDGGVPAGITLEGLKADIEMLLEGENTDLPELRSICNAIESVNSELANLYGLIDKHLPYKTNGNCNDLSVVGKNRLLEMLFTIQDSQVSFSCGIEQVRRATEKILKGKEQTNLF